MFDPHRFDQEDYHDALQAAQQKYEREKEEWMEKGRAARGLLEWASKYRKAMNAAEN